MSIVPNCWMDQVALGMEVGLGPGHIVLDGNPVPLPKKWAKTPIFGPCLLWSNGWMDKNGTYHGGGPRSRPHCARWGRSSPPKKGQSHLQFSAPFYCGQTAEYIKIPLGVEVGLGRGHIVLDGDQAPSKRRGNTPQFWAHICCGKTAG